MHFADQEADTARIDSNDKFFWQIHGKCPLAAAA
jgi:hypothetical protein